MRQLQQKQNGIEVRWRDRQRKIQEPNASNIDLKI